MYYCRQKDINIGPKRFELLHDMEHIDLNTSFGVIYLPVNVTQGAILYEGRSKRLASRASTRVANF